MPTNATQPNHINLIYMYKRDWTLNNLQCLICHKTKVQTNQNCCINSLGKSMNPLIPRGTG